MKLSCFLAFFLLWVVNSFRTSATVPDSLLTERTIRSIRIALYDCWTKRKKVRLPVSFPFGLIYCERCVMKSSTT